MTVSKHKFAGLAGVLSITAVLAGCSTGQADGASASGDIAQYMTMDLAALAEIAAEEGPVHVYGAAQTTNKNIWDSFQQEFPGVTVEPTDIFGPELTAKLESEQIAGGDADAVISGRVDLDTYAEKQLLADFRPQEAGELREEFQIDAPYVLPMGIPVAGVARSDASIDQGTEWEALLDEFKVAVTDPSIPTVASQAIAQLLQDGVITEDLVSGELRSSATLAPSGAQTIQLVASGQTDVAVAAAYDLVRLSMNQGAPIQPFSTGDQDFVMTLGYGVLESSDNPAGAVLLGRWMLSEKAQQPLQERYMFGARESGGQGLEGLPEDFLETAIVQDLSAEEMGNWTDFLVETFAR